jgi:hypothetical protein
LGEVQSVAEGGLRGALTEHGEGADPEHASHDKQQQTKIQEQLISDFHFP